MTSPPRRTTDVALSAAALAHQWARQEAAPHGAVVVANREIAARGRGGHEWVADHAVAVSLVARPNGLAPSSAEVAWLAAGLAAAEVCSTNPTLTSSGSVDLEARLLHWPDQLVPPIIDGEPTSVPATSILVESILDPGQVAYAVLTVRLASPVLHAAQNREQVTESTVACLRYWADRLSESTVVAAAYRDRCATLGRAVSVQRVTGGTIRGTATDVTKDGALVVSSPTGLNEPVGVSATRAITLI